ncbi:MAG: MATE family efflux transporter [Eubacteriales bacterium]|nr:MATE family efflux transporter [Eubacteriales bacterium]
MKTAENSLEKDILIIAIPTFLETMFVTFSSIADSKMVSAMGVTAIAAVSVTNQPRLFVYALFFAINTVTTSLIAKYRGKEDRETANRVFDHAMKLIFILSVVLGTLAVGLARPVMILFSGQPDTQEDSIIYFRIVMGGMIFNLLFMEINAALRGIARTTLTFTDNVLSCVVNLFFNYLLIEGHWGFPALGIAGAAIATVLGNVAACILSVAFVFNKNLLINIPYCLDKRYRMSRDTLEELLTETRSCAIDNLAMRVTLLVISGIIARIGSFQMAIYSVGNYLLNVNLALGTGLQTSAVSLIGKSYGENNYQRIKDYRRSILKLGMIGAVILAVLIAGGGRAFFMFFSTDETFVATGAVSCLFIGVITIFQTLKFINGGCLQGVGMMKEVMYCSIISFSCVNLPVVALLVLGFHKEVLGVWTASLLAQAVQAFLLRRFIVKAPMFSGSMPQNQR